VAPLGAVHGRAPHDPRAFLHAYENLQDLETVPDAAHADLPRRRGSKLARALLWTQVGRWTAWRRQARALSWAWLLYFLMPFLVFLYPLRVPRSTWAKRPRAAPPDAARDRHADRRAGAALARSQVISLLQGLIRARLATKCCSRAPGPLADGEWAAYMTSSMSSCCCPITSAAAALVVAGMLLVLAARARSFRAGLRLTKPMPADAARHATKKTLTLWMTLLIAGAACIVAGLWQTGLAASPLTLVSFALTMAANILLLTLIATDALNHRARPRAHDGRRASARRRGRRPGRGVHHAGAHDVAKR